METRAILPPKAIDCGGRYMAGSNMALWSPHAGARRFGQPGKRYEMAGDGRHVVFPTLTDFEYEWNQQCVGAMETDEQYDALMAEAKCWAEELKDGDEYAVNVIRESLPFLFKETTDGDKE